MMLIRNVNLPFFYFEKAIYCFLSLVYCDDADVFCGKRQLTRLKVLNTWLSPQEFELFASIKSEKRKLQYAMGRIAAKRALLSINHRISASSINVTNAKNGAPIVENSPYRVSISHSENYAASLVFEDSSPEFSFGIDIQRIDKTKVTALKYPTNATEPIDTNDVGYLTMAWSLKESLSKAMLCGFTVPFEEFSIKKLTNDPLKIAEYANHPKYKGVAAIFRSQRRCDGNNSNGGNGDNSDNDNDHNDDKYVLAITYNSKLTTDFQAIYAAFASIFA